LTGLSNLPAGTSQQTDTSAGDYVSFLNLPLIEINARNGLCY
jgi:hypothetical protein